MENLQENQMSGKLTSKVLAILAIIVVCTLGTSCSKKEESAPVVVKNDDNIPDEVFNGPTYADNYTRIGDWASRNQWNLANVHDPTIVKDGNYFYMYQTDASYGNAHDGHGHFHCRRSTDLVNWEYIGSSMDEAPAWIKTTMNSKRAQMGLAPIENPRYAYWAPCVRKVGNVFRMYYSIVVDELIVGANGAASWGERPYIGLRETTSLSSNQWVDKGMVITSEPDGVVDYIRDGANDWNSYYKFNAIDPSYIVAATGEHWLIYGSWMTGIAAVQVDATTGKPSQLNTIEDYGIRIAARGNLSTNRWHPLEGAEIIYNPATQYYYLFMANDELSVAYNTRVARSTSITGPYYGKDGGNVSAGAECWPMLTHPYAFNNHTGWVGISHCSVFQDEANNKWYFASQGRLPENVPGINASNAVMMGHVREMQWTSDGWPVVSPERYAGVPDKDIEAQDLQGNWEIITMNYAFRTIQRPVNATINSNGSIGGGYLGAWTYDKTAKTITINGMECKVFRSWDWEASPRRVTLTFSGLTAAGKPVWGKKVK